MISEVYQAEFELLNSVNPVFPSTRYQGSKTKFISWIWKIVENLDFNSVLDAFGGTGCFAYQCKLAGKAVTYNDILPFNCVIGKALIENQTEFLTCKELDFVLNHNDPNHPQFIYDTFRDIYYTDDENKWLDRVVYNIKCLDNEYKKSLAYFSLFQSCICKRPYNLFHRKNLYIRMNDVQRSFGNKKTWDTPFEVHFRNFAKEANAAVFDNGNKCRSLCFDAVAAPGNYDLVYIDTPYINEAGIGVDYAAFYHFLNGILDYNNWQNKIDYGTKHKKLITTPSRWNNSEEITQAFTDLFKRYSESIVVISYRNNGTPDVDTLIKVLCETHRDISVYQSAKMKYTLSKRASNEVLFVAKPK